MSRVKVVSCEGCVLVETVGELIVSNYTAESINNWLQDVSAT